MMSPMLPDYPHHFATAHAPAMSVTDTLMTSCVWSDCAGNTDLTDLSGFSELVNVSAQVGIGDHPSLVTITGFTNLVNIGGNLEIAMNANLRSGVEWFAGVNKFCSSANGIGQILDQDLLE